MPEALMPPEEREELELDRVWNELVRGRPGTPGEACDPTVVEAMRAFQAMATAPPPATSRGHVDRTVLAGIERRASERRQEASVDQLGSVAIPQTSFGPNGATRSVVPETIVARRVAGWSGMATRVATAALVLLTLVTGYVAFGGPLRPRQPDTRIAAIPAIDGTPADSPSSGLTQDTILFQQRIEVIPDSAGWTGIEHYTFAPGETWEQGKTPGAGRGPMLYRLEGGTMTVRAAAPFILTRAGARAGTEVPQETAVVLAPGDVVFMPFGVVSAWRNDGTMPAQLLEAGIALLGTQAKAGDYYYDAFTFAWPPTPVTVTLRRGTLSPGGHVPIAAEPGLAYLGLERATSEAQAGRLTIVWVDPATPTAAPQAQQLTSPTASDVSAMLTDLRPSGASPRLAQELRNDSDAPVTFLMWTITPVGESAPRPATPMP